MVNKVQTMDTKRESTTLLNPLEKGPIALFLMISFTTSIALV